MSDKTKPVKSDIMEKDIIVVKVGSEENEKVFHLERNLLLEFPELRSLIKEASSNHPKELVFADITPRAFRIFQKFIMTSRVFIRGVEDLVELYELCFKYNIESLKDHCRSLCKANLNVSTVCAILHIAEFWNDESLSQKCINVIKSNTDQVINSPSFTSASLPVVIAIVKCSSLTLQSEGELFAALVKWGKEQCRQSKLHATPTNLRLVLHPLLCYIRFLDMTSDQFVELVVSEEILSKDEERAILINLIMNMEHIAPIPETFSNSRSCRYLCNETVFSLNDFASNHEIYDDDQAFANSFCDTNNSLPYSCKSTATPVSNSFNFGTVTRKGFRSLGGNRTSHVSVHNIPSGSVFHLKLQVCKGVIELSRIGLYLHDAHNENTPVPVIITASVVNSRNRGQSVTGFKSYIGRSRHIDCRPVQVKEGEILSVNIECLRDSKCFQIYKLIELPFSQDMENSSVVVKENSGVANTYIHSITVSHK